MDEQTKEWAGGQRSIFIEVETNSVTDKLLYIPTVSFFAGLPIRGYKWLGNRLGISLVVTGATLSCPVFSLAVVNLVKLQVFLFALYMPTVGCEST